MMLIKNWASDIEVSEHVSGGLVSVDEVRNVDSDYFLAPVAGDCLEGAGINDGDWVAVDRTRFPIPKNKDICSCYAKFPGSTRPAVMLKVYDGVWGNWQMVSTKYAWSNDNFRLNCGMQALEIFGTVFACWDKDGKNKWVRDLSDHPTELGMVPTIKGDNVSNPREIKNAPAATEAQEPRPSTQDDYILPVAGLSTEKRAAV